MKAFDATKARNDLATYLILGTFHSSLAIDGGDSEGKSAGSEKG